MEFKDEIFNGKTVAEIFAQRGKKVKPSKMKKGEVYLLTKGMFEWDRICKHIQCLDEDKLWASSLLYDDGMVYFNGFVFAKHCSDVFEATSDQIELLNSKTK